MHEPFDALLQLDERAVVGDRNDLALNARTDRVLLVDVRPRIRQKLLETERDALAVPIDVENLHVDPCGDVHHFRWMPDPAPRHVGDVQEPVESAQVDERTEVGDVLDLPFANLPDQELLYEGLALGLTLGLKNHATRNDDVPPTLVELDDLELVHLADKVLDIGDPAKRDLRTR